MKEMRCTNGCAFKRGNYNGGNLFGVLSQGGGTSPATKPNKKMTTATASRELEDISSNLLFPA